MPLVGWSDRYSIGVYLFDVEHMQFLALLNDLYDAIVCGLSEPAVNSVLNGAIAFAERHFAHEEEFFAVSGYPGAEAHCAEHRRLLEEIYSFRQLREAGDLRALTIDLNIFLVRWFTEHTMGQDREFGAHLRAIGVR